MKAEKDKKTGKWLIQYRYTDWQGKRRKSTKRGFATKREAEEWLRNFLITQKADFDMKFEDFWKMYYLFHHPALYYEIFCLSKTHCYYPFPVLVLILPNPSHEKILHHRRLLSYILSVQYPGSLAAFYNFYDTYTLFPIMPSSI